MLTLGSPLVFILSKEPSCIVLGSWDFPALWIVLASLRRCCAERGSAATETTDLAVAGLKAARTR